MARDAGRGTANFESSLPKATAEDAHKKGRKRTQRCGGTYVSYVRILFLRAAVS
jgi:hypothetical protein